MNKVAVATELVKIADKLIQGAEGEKGVDYYPMMLHEVTDQHDLAEAPKWQSLITELKQAGLTKEAQVLGAWIKASLALKELVYGPGDEGNKGDIDPRG